MTHSKLKPHKKKKSKASPETETISSNTGAVLSVSPSEGQGSGEPIKIVPRANGERIDSMMQRIYDGIKQCAAACGIPIEALRLAKKSGSDAFRNSRVDLVLFLQWWFAQDSGSNDLSGGMSWTDALAKEKTLRERIRREQDEGKTVDRAEVVTAISKGEAIGDAYLDRQFNVTLPAELVGRDAAYISRRLVEIKTEYHRLRRAEHEKLAKGRHDE